MEYLFQRKKKPNTKKPEIKKIEESILETLSPDDYTKFIKIEYLNNTKKQNIINNLNTDRYKLNVTLRESNIITAKYTNDNSSQKIIFIKKPSKNYNKKDYKYFIYDRYIKVYKSI